MMGKKSLEELASGAVVLKGGGWGQGSGERHRGVTRCMKFAMCSTSISDRVPIRLGLGVTQAAAVTAYVT